MSILSYEEKDLFKRSAAFLKPYKKQIACLYIATIVSSVFELLPTYILGRIIDFTVSKMYYKIINCIFVLFVIFVMTCIFSYIETYLTNLLNNKITYDVKKEVFFRIEHLPMTSFNKLRTGDFISILEGDTSNVSKFYIESLLNIILSFFRLLVSIIFIFKISVSLSLISICTFPISFFVYYIFSKKNKEYVKIGRRLNDNNYSFIQEVFSSIREVKSLTIENKLFGEYRSLLNRIVDNNIKTSLISIYSALLNLLISNISEWIIIAYGCWLIIQERFSIGSYVSFNGYLKTFLTSLHEVLAINITIQAVSVSFKRIYGLLDEEIEDVKNINDTSLHKGELKIDNLRFSYNECDGETIQDISLNIRENSISAFVGTSGCGKTTLFDLIVRFIDYKSGNIYIDEKDIKEIDLMSLRKNIAYIQQEPFIFNSTIKENLLFGNSSATMDEIISACKTANIHTFIESLPDKYDTLLSERGSRLSGGERQRLAIARAILKDSKIILLDEATSALDGESEAQVINNLMELSKNHTIIIIAHRITTVMNIPNIYVFDEGKIDSIGDHKTLINSCDVYKRLYSKQWETYTSQFSMKGV